MSDHLVIQLPPLSKGVIETGQKMAVHGDVKTIQTECLMTSGYEEMEITNTQNKGFR